MFLMYALIRNWLHSYIAVNCLYWTKNFFGVYFLIRLSGLGFVCRLVSVAHGTEAFGSGGFFYIFRVIQKLQLL